MSEWVYSPFGRLDSNFEKVESTRSAVAKEAASAAKTKDFIITNIFYLKIIK